MSRLLVDLLNAILLGLVFIGVPAAASARFLGVHISSSGQTRQLILGGLGLGLAANALSALLLAKKKPTRATLLRWTAVFAALLTLAGLEAAGIIGFAWLRHALRWIKGLF
ncbi:MAG: hypothetical protein HYR88_16010 [Verrucomicrobia bacterium]|nr:hypothetical protein [Verrucomicrobiota bacterium]MBI3868070.1 hypothetical protein [Verrucomicrobiota bacterium]